MKYKYLPEATIKSYSFDENECKFFNCLLEKSKHLPFDFELFRSSLSAPFTVTYNHGGYVGKVKLKDQLFIQVQYDDNSNETFTGISLNDCITKIPIWVNYCKKYLNEI